MTKYQPKWGTHILVEYDQKPRYRSRKESERGAFRKNRARVRKNGASYEVDRAHHRK